MKIKNLFLLAALGLMASATLTSCEDVLGHWEKPSPNPITPGTVTPTVEEVIKYGFKVTDLAGVDRTEAVTSLKMSNDDATVATAEVSGGKITIKADDLKEITTAMDFWFEAEIGGKPYVAKVNIDPATLSPETDKTLEMATLGDVIKVDGKFYKAGTDGAVAKICYLGSETAEAANGFNHGLALTLSDANGGSTCNWKTEKTDAGHTKQTSSTFTEESGLQYNATHNTSEYLAFLAAIANNGTTSPAGCSSWFLASCYQWTKILNANGISKLLTTANGFEGMGSACHYWTSSERDADGAWYYSFPDACFASDSKSYKFQVRSCLAF